jgi:hypothetical protein
LITPKFYLQSTKVLFGLVVECQYIMSNGR